MIKYIVVKERVSEFENPIQVNKGEHVLVKEFSDPNGEWAGWIFCETKNNSGWLPDNIVSYKADLGLVEENYNAFEFDLNEGEIVTQLSENNGWIWCFKDGDPDILGWAPLNHIKKI